MVAISSSRSSATASVGIMRFASSTSTSAAAAAGAANSARVPLLLFEILNGRGIVCHSNVHPQ